MDYRPLAGLVAFIIAMITNSICAGSESRPFLLIDLISTNSNAMTHIRLSMHFYALRIVCLYIIKHLTTNTIL